ncbi:flagellar hook-associated protein FlgK [Caldifermentibacillus hisashii]|uniref:flagellar hook-associated protein FlgK n=1 Tax=Caldifermentibacillus hisashii TaxID=996558 RepID=UPI002E1EFE5B|nr:flagellar hook-associated protein FlgK [Caldifermentibacillus hisashii]
MVSTFHGLETAKRGMTAQQLGLYTTGHNISNANTPGYTRQRVSFETAEPFPGAGLNRPQIPGQLGTGVQAGTIERIRESFLDVQYRSENTKLGYYSSLSSALAKMEDIMNEPSNSGLQNIMSQFWSSLQNMADHPENLGARQVVAAKGQMVAETFNYYYNSLDGIKKDLGSEMDVTVKNINTIVSQIDELNKQIASVEPHGMLPNDLYDKRDQLVDQLSSLVNVKVRPIKPIQYGQPLPTAVGLYQIELVQNDEAQLLTVDGTTGASQQNELSITAENGVKAPPLKGNVQSVQVGSVTLDNFSGKLKGLIESYGYIGANDKVKGHYPEMMEKLNKLAYAFANEFNHIHQQGYGLEKTARAGVFFDLSGSTDNNYAQIIRVHDEIIKDPTNIAAAAKKGGDNSGDNTIAFQLADLKKKNFKEYSVPLPNDMSGTFDFYYAAMIGELGVAAQSANTNMENVQVLVDSVEYNRQSVSGVSLDEELTNMITFQHAYNASARMITVIDEMLDKIINGMGVVGR